MFVKQVNLWKIWNSTFLIDKSSGDRSTMHRAENISIFGEFIDMQILLKEQLFFYPNEKDNGKIAWKTEY